MPWLIRSLLSLIFVAPVIAYAQVKVSSKDFHIISATVSEWSSGAARENSNGQRGVQYEIMAVAKSKMKVFVDSLITGKGRMPVEVIVNFKRNASKEQVKKSDTIQFIARFPQASEVPRPSKEVLNAIAKFSKTNQLSFLLYRIKGKRCLVPVGEFRKSAKAPNQ